LVLVSDDGIDVPDVPLQLPLELSDPQVLLIEPLLVLVSQISLLEALLIET
jgi:hypothetical protein